MPRSSGSHASDAVLAALEEYAIEASILKVASSEMLDFVVDENVQIHGGNGFVRDYPAERHYRDARVNRIFEGTNEINRLLIPGMLIRRALKGGLPIIAAAKRLQDEMLSPAPAGTAVRRAARERAARGDGDEEGGADDPRDRHADLRRAAHRSAGSADGGRRCHHRRVRGGEHAAPGGCRPGDRGPCRFERRRGRSRRAPSAAARVFISDAAGRVEIGARAALAAMAEGDTLRTLLAALRRLLKVTPVNTVALRRQVSDAVVAGKKYPF